MKASRCSGPGQLKLKSADAERSAYQSLSAILSEGRETLKIDNVKQGKEYKARAKRTEEANERASERYLARARAREATDKPRIDGAIGGRRVY